MANKTISKTRAKALVLEIRNNAAAIGSLVETFGIDKVLSEEHPGPRLREIISEHLVVVDGTSALLREALVDGEF